MQFIIFSLVILLSSGLNAQSTDSLLTEGIQFYSEKKWDDAEVSFKKALEQKPNDPNILSNLALVQMEKANEIQAYAFWRKALYYHPFYTPAVQGIEYLEKNGKVQTTEASRVASFMHNLFRSPPLYSYLVVWIFLFLCLHSLHRYLLAKKQAREEEDNPPAFPIKLCLYTVLFLLSVVFTTQQYLDRNMVRGLSTSTVQTYLSPSSESPALFTLSPGEQVDILNEKDTWLQIRSRQDQRAWIEKDKIFIF